VPVDPCPDMAVPVDPAVPVVLVDDRRRLDASALFPQPVETELSGCLDQLLLGVGDLRGDLGDLAGLGSDNSPARNASAATGRSARWSTISMVRIAVPTAVPVLDAIHAAAERNPSRRHNALSCNDAVTKTRTAAKSRSASAHSSTNRAALRTSRVSTSTPATTDRIEPNT